MILFTTKIAGLAPDLGCLFRLFRVKINLTKFLFRSSEQIEVFLINHVSK